MSFLPLTSSRKAAGKSSDHTALIAIMIALPLTLAGTAFLTFLLDAGSRLGL
jgi:hypothetical protein